MLRNRALTVAAAGIGLLLIIFALTLALHRQAAIPGVPTAKPLSDQFMWTRWDVTISQIDTAHNSFHVSETQQTTGFVGIFSRGQRRIPLTHLSAVDHIQVSDDNRPLAVQESDAAHCPATPGIACIEMDSNHTQQIIIWNFLQPAASGDTRTIRCEYDVYGALRSYTGGDKLWWPVLPADHPFPVLKSEIAVQLPPGLKPEQFGLFPGTWSVQSQLEQAPGDAILPSQKGQHPSALTVIFDSVETLTPVIADAPSEVLWVQYPHNPAMAAPAWQAAYDRSELF